MNAKKLLCALFAVVALFSVTACQQTLEPTVDSLSIAGYDTEFTVGDTFDDGELVVTAKYTDETTKDVTAEATVTQNADMTTPGSYAVLVSFGGQTVAYQITVSAPEKVLESISVNATDAKLSYIVGETISYENLAVVATYDDESSAYVTDYTTAVADEKGNAVEGAFTTFGTYTVTVTLGEATDSYKVEVKNASFETVADAIAVGVANANKVNGGNATVHQYGTSEFEYTFGDNFTVINQISDETIYHYEDLGDDVYFGFYEGVDWEGNPELRPVDTEYIYAEHFCGPEIYHVIGGLYFYGAEDLVDGLYALAGESGQDLKETISVCPDCGYQSFEYSFGYNNVDYGQFYVITVEFELDFNNAMTKVAVSSIKYNATDSDDNPNYYVDEETGYVTLDSWASVTNVTDVVYEQTVGARSTENEYPYSELMYSAFDLVDEEGNELKEHYDVQAGDQLVFNLENTLPETAVGSLNDVKVSFDATSDWDYSLYSSFDEGVLTITVNNARDYEVTVTCGSVVKEFTITATQPNPESITPYASQLVEDWWSGDMIPEMFEGNTATMTTAESVFVGALINPSKAEQDVTVSLKEAYTTAELSYADPYDWSQVVPYFDNDLYKFTATEAGTYVVVVSSTSVPTISAEITITVTAAEPGEEETPTASIIGTWTAKHPLTGMDFATIEFMDGGYAQFSSGVTNGMLSYEVVGSTVTFTIPLLLQGTIDITNATVNDDFTEMPATVSFNGEPADLTFTKPAVSTPVEEATIEGDWSGSFPHPLNPSLPCTCTMTFESDDTGTGNFNGTEFSFIYSYYNEQLSIVIMGESAVALSNINCATDFSEITLTATIEGLDNPVDITFTK